MRYGLLFPGQGSHYVGMCARLVSQYEIARHIFEQAADILRYDLYGLISSATIKELSLSSIAQPAVVVASYALYSVFRHCFRQDPSAVLGHSLGEISALIAVEAIPFVDGLAFVQKRGELMLEAEQMNLGASGIVVDVSQKKLQAMIASFRSEHFVTITGYNSPNQLMVGGTEDGLDMLVNMLDQQGGEYIPFKMMPMKATAPFHCSLMQSLQAKYSLLVKELKIGKPKYPLWSTIRGAEAMDHTLIRESLQRQLLSPVLWQQALVGMAGNGLDRLIDIGPGETMKNLVFDTPGLPKCIAFDLCETRDSVLIK